MTWRFIAKIKITSFGVRRVTAYCLKGHIDQVLHCASELKPASFMPVKCLWLGVVSDRTLYKIIYGSNIIQPFLPSAEQVSCLPLLFALPQYSYSLVFT